MTEEMEERYKLVCDRIREIRKECDVIDGEKLSDAALDYFFEVSNLAIGLMPIIKRTERHETKEATLADFVDEQKTINGLFTVFLK